MDSNDDYCPIEPIYYNYRVKNLLMRDVALFADTNEYSSIILCVYKVDTSGKFPFLQFLLTDNGLSKLSLPSLPIFNAFNKSNLISYSNVFLSGLLEVKNFEKFNEQIEFDGFFEFGSNLYLFYDVTKCDYNFDDTSLFYQLRFALTDEILNHKNVCNLEICNDTINFFLKNDTINYLHDINNEAYEIPVVGFVGKPTPGKLKFTGIFGESPKDKTAILGPYYYFTDYFNAVKQSNLSNEYNSETIFNNIIKNNINKKGGIVRFALFTGQTKYIENMPNDSIDESETKKFRLEDTKENKMYEIQTLRISDHDGNWAKNYDSVYLGNIELDDGTSLKDTPIFVMKEYNQQIPLSYHFIIKVGLGDKIAPLMK